MFFIGYDFFIALTIIDKFRLISSVDEFSSHNTIESQRLFSNRKTTCSGSKLEIVSEPRCNRRNNKLEVNKLIESLMCDFSNNVGSLISKIILDVYVLSIISSAVISMQLHLEIMFAI